MRCLQDYYDFYHLQFIIKQFEFYESDGRYKCRTLGLLYNTMGAI